MRFPRPSDVATTALLTSEQIIFRGSRVSRILDDALPFEVWRRHGFLLARGQKSRPPARRGDELWYNAGQIEFAVSEKSESLYTVQGGAMGGLGGKVGRGLRSPETRRRHKAAMPLSWSMVRAGRRSSCSLYL